MTQNSTDRIEKQVLLSHPRAKVWRAVTDSKEFGQWFGVNLTGEFKPGARLSGRVTHKGYEHITMEIVIERMEPERLLSWRWHPGVPELGQPFTDETPTLVVFELKDVPGGTLLTVVESGFDQIPLARRSKALKENEGGWTAQMKAIEAHLDRNA